jgi:hypothetical protein
MTISLSGYCMVERCILVKTGHLSLEGGNVVAKYTNEDYKIRPHNVPLFTDREQRSGVCNSCLHGWTHPDNAPTEKGHAQIAAARESTVSA